MAYFAAKFIIKLTTRFMSMDIVAKRLDLKLVGKPS